MVLVHKKINLFLGSFAALAYLTGCTEPNGSTPKAVLTEDATEGPLSAYDVNQHKLNQIVCDPFDGGGNTTFNGGIQADLYYRGAGQERYYDVMKYIEYGQKSSKTLFFSDINVPTRLWTAGFPTETGEVIQDDSGEDLHEYFALDMKTIIQLGPDDEPGLYELALLSDDGSILKMRNSQGIYEVVVDNDGDHPTRFGCSSVAIELTQETEIPTLMHYYQGPRQHIALIPMWRKINSPDEAGKDPQCGKTGNTLYFDYNNNSAPKSAYLGLLERGWKPLDSDNYYIPNQAVYNPCVSGQAPVISGLDINEDIDNPGILRVAWVTDILATSQVRVVNLYTGEEIITDADNILRIDHVVAVEGLSKNTPYLIQAVSISETFGKSLSEAITIELE
ncbi:MAG: hypothetical protein CL677_02715 [Bdellovibrionaceae bacterium]|nr:hypothetical protein [Pseudobdellovibrionaceae bacterium]|tara:strand:+ start:50453 stop:51628 length:1176 start_codon:yes stop_codon:yes gene_type:complete